MVTSWTCKERVDSHVRNDFPLELLDLEIARVRDPTF